MKLNSKQYTEQSHKIFTCYLKIGANTEVNVLYSEYMAN